MVRVRLSAAAFLALLCLGVAALAANFPALTGRIVDQANVIPVGNDKRPLGPWKKW